MTFRATFKLYRRVHIALRHKMPKPPISRHPVERRAVIMKPMPSDLRHGQFKTFKMKKMTVQVDFWLFVNAFLAGVQYIAHKDVLTLQLL